MNTDSTEEIKVIFDFLDTDKNGFLDTEELQCGLSILKLNLAGVQINNIMKMIDVNNDGKVDFEEFMKICVIGAAKDKIKPSELAYKLTPYDKDKDGRIDVGDLKILLGGEGEPLDEEDVDDIIKDLNVGSDGKINIKEMIKKLLS